MCRPCLTQNHGRGVDLLLYGTSAILLVCAGPESGSPSILQHHLPSKADLGNKFRHPSHQDPREGNIEDSVVILASYIDPDIPSGLS